jgi:glutamate/tyrosine decarboxylase-like PLP-dependent enzyme
MEKNLKTDQKRFPKILQKTLKIAQERVANIKNLPPALPSEKVSDSQFPTNGIGAESAIDLFQAKYAHLMAATTGPRYWGFVTGGVTPAALAGDWLASTYDQNPQDNNRTGDISVVVEWDTVQMMRSLFGLPDYFFGGFTSGATLSNFTGLAVGRQWVGKELGVDIAQEGMTALADFTVLSSVPHSCIHKDLAMLGIGRKNLVKIAALPKREAMDIKDLERKLIAQNGKPCIVTTSGGTVNTVDFDDMKAIAALKKRYNFWWHIDAAFGGFAACSPKFAALLEGWHEADSIGIDLHKWLNVPYGSAISFVHEKHAALQLNTFQNANAAYLGDPNAAINMLNYVPENSRRQLALPAWMSLMAYGREGYRDIVERNVADARHFGKLIDKSADFQLLAPVRLNVVCFTLKNKDAASVAAFLERVNRSGKAYMTPTVYADKTAIRAAFVNWSTERADVNMVFNLMQSLGK